MGVSRSRRHSGRIFLAALALAVFGPPAALRARPSALAPQNPCSASATNLCLNGERFKIEVQWRDFQGNTGTGQAIPLTGDTGYFWFFTSTNVELVVKVLDASGINGYFWVFYGALSNVEYQITVTDTVTDAVKQYSNTLGQFGSAGDTEAFPGVVAAAPAAAPEAISSLTRASATCTPGATALCLAAGRFRVEVNWTDFQGKTGRGQAVGLTADTGYFWFFNSANVELVVKVLDANGVNGKHWVFYGALSNVEYDLVVIDTVTGESRRYKNPPGQFASSGDTKAFPLEPGTPYPALTAVGAPDGTPNSGMIGPAGGSVTSEDGRLTLTVPSGALSSETAFTVQPVTNQAPGGVGRAYRIEPEGQIFAAEARIAFRYSDEDLAGTAPEALVLAYQDDQAFWRAIRSSTLDTANRTVTASTTHLSTWSALADHQLSPGSATVLVTKTQALELVFCRHIDLDGLVTLMAACAPETDSDIGRLAEWSVNGTAGGNATFGTITPAGDFAGVYTAPDGVPQPSLVAVSARMLGSLGGGIRVVSNITVYDGWTGTGHWQTCGSHAFSATTDVTWSLDDAGQQNGISNYRPISIRSTAAVAGCSLNPSGVTTGNSGSGILTVDANTTPAGYTGLGILLFDSILSCPGEEPAPLHVPVTYFGPVQASDNKHVTADGLTIGGAFTDGCTTVDWTFARR